MGTILFPPDARSRFPRLTAARRLCAHKKRLRSFERIEFVRKKGSKTSRRPYWNTNFIENTFESSSKRRRRRRRRKNGRPRGWWEQFVETLDAQDRGDFVVVRRENDDDDDGEKRARRKRKGRRDGR